MIAACFDLFSKIQILSVTNYKIKEKNREKRKAYNSLSPTKAKEMFIRASVNRIDILWNAGGR